MVHAAENNAMLLLAAGPFLNPIMLIGLGVVSIPIIIHILNRRRAHIVDWGAMQFLETSLTSRSRRILIEEIILMALRCGLLALLVLALARPYFFPGRLLFGGAGQAQDIAIVLDGSLSMTLRTGGKSAFARAVEEAKQVLEVSRPADAICVIVAGSAADPIVPRPLSDRRALRKSLEEAMPIGGSLDVPKALTEAVRCLAGGTNPAKKIVLITDGQKIGWELSAEKRWSFLAEESSETLPMPPAVIVRTLPPPKQWRNVAVTQLHLDRAAVGTDRPVKISVTVANTGVGAIEPEAVELSVDGQPLPARRRTGQIAEGASATVIFEHQFEHSGPHILTATARCKDDLPGDNQTTRVVNVLEALPVLVIEGEHSTRPLGSDASFLRLALAPPPGEQGGDQPAEPQDKTAHLIRPTVVPVAEARSVGSLEPYRVVILADVPRLPKALAEAIARFVAAGGGLLVAPGEKADKTFYEHWTGPDQKRLLGCRLREFQPVAGPEVAGPAERALHVAPNTIDHPALKLLADPSVSDLASVRLRRRWLLLPEEEKDVSVGARLDNSEPFLVQRKVGRGFVLTLTVPLDRQASDLPVHKCYVPMVHEMVYYLAAPSQVPMNLQPGQQLLWPVSGKVRGGDVAEVITPDGRRQPARLQRRGDGWQVTYAHTARSGLYRVALPDEALGPLATRPAVARKDSGPGGVPFVVLEDPGESRLEPLPAEDYDRAGRFLNLKRAETLSELVHAIQGGLPVSELWKLLAVLCAGLLVLEILTTRAIAIRRQVHTARPVAFGTDQVDAERFRADTGGKTTRPTPQEELVP